MVSLQEEPVWSLGAMAGYIYRYRYIHISIDIDIDKDIQSSISTSFTSTDSTNCGLKILIRIPESPKSKTWLCCALAPVHTVFTLH